MCFGKLLELFEGAFQVVFGGQRLTQHLHGAAQVEEQVGVAAFLSPRMHEASFRFLQLFSVRNLLIEGSGRVKQGFAQVVVAAKLAWFEIDGLVLGLQVLGQVTLALVGVIGGQAFFPVAQTFALLYIAVQRVDESGQAELLRRRLDGDRLGPSRACVEFGKFQWQQIGLDLKQQATEQRGKARQFGTKPGDPAQGFVDFQRLKGGFHLSRAQQQVALQAGQELVARADGFELLGFIQRLVPALQLSQSQGAIEVENRGWPGFRQSHQGVLRLLGFQLDEGDLIEPALVWDRLFLQQDVGLR